MILESPTIIRLEIERTDIGKVIREIPMESILIVPAGSALSGRFSYYLYPTHFKRHYIGEYLHIRDMNVNKVVLLDFNMDVVYYFNENEYEYYFSGKPNIIRRQFKHKFQWIKKVSVVVPNIQLPTFKDKVNFEEEVNKACLIPF